MHIGILAVAFRIWYLSYSEPCTFTFSVRSRKYQICWNMLVIHNAWQGGEISALLSPVCPLVPLQLRVNNNRSLTMEDLHADSFSLCIIMRCYVMLLYLNLLCSPGIYSFDQLLDPCFSRIGTDGPLFCPLLDHKPKKTHKNQLLYKFHEWSKRFWKGAAWIHRSPGRHCLFPSVFSQLLIFGSFSKVLSEGPKNKEGHNICHSHNSSYVAVTICFLPPVTFSVSLCIWSQRWIVSQAAVAIGAWRERHTQGGVTQIERKTLECAIRFDIYLHLLQSLNLLH